MVAGYNHRCVEGSKRALIKAEQTKRRIEEEEAQASESKYLKSEDRAAKNCWDSVIQW